MFIQKRILSHNVIRMGLGLIIVAGMLTVNPGISAQAAFQEPEIELPAGQMSIDLPHQSIAVGNQMGCALQSTGNVVCWGANYEYYNMYGAAGYRYVPALPSGVTYTQVTVGNMVMCATRSDGNAVCWGSTTFGLVYVPALPSGVTYTQISAGDYHICALRSDGNIVCWGYTSSGRTVQCAGVIAILTVS